MRVNNGLIKHPPPPFSPLRQSRFPLTPHHGEEHSQLMMAVMMMVSVTAVMVVVVMSVVVMSVTAVMVMVMSVMSMVVVVIAVVSVVAVMVVFVDPDASHAKTEASGSVVVA